MRGQPPQTAARRALRGVDLRGVDPSTRHLSLAVARALGRARDSGLGRAYDIMSPLYSSKWDPEPIDFELTMQETYIGKPPKKVRL